MRTIRFKGRDYEGQDGESVLTILLSHKLNIPYSCTAGACHACLMRRTDGEVPESAQPGLKASLKQQQYFLACQFVPDEDISVSLADGEDVSAHATISQVEHLDDATCRIFLEPATPLYYHAGQYINLCRSDGLVRSYSLASVPGLDSSMEIHVRRMQNGKMSNWLHDKVKAGDHIDFQGPYGDCLYVNDAPGQDMLLIGTGTGLAPLIGIARDALNSGHQGQIYLYHGSRSLAGLYRHQQLRQLANDHTNFHYISCVSGDNEVIAEDPAIRHGRANDLAFADITDLKNMRVFLCGHPEMVKQSRRIAFLNGASMNQIMADPFEMQELRTAPRN